MHIGKVAAVATSCALGCIVHIAYSQSQYPQRPIRIVVPFVAGGGSDFVSRALGQRLEAILGQPVLMDYRPGGNGVIASEVVANATPDGHTVYMAGSSFASLQSLHPKLAFNLLTDFAPISAVSVTPAVLVVHPTLPVRSVKDLVSLAKIRPGELTYGSSGVGSASFLAGEQFKMLANIDLLHVPFKGSAQVSVSLLSGETFIAIINPISILPNIKAGRLRALGVTTSERSILFPELPTLAEAGIPGYENTIWTGLMAPGKTPRPIVSRLNEAVRKSLQSPELVKILATNGATPSPTSPEELVARIRNEIDKTARIMKQSGVVVR